VTALGAPRPGQTAVVEASMSEQSIGASDTAIPASPCLLDIERISKRFPGVQALTDVSMQVRAGSVHALVGENGAGKSTLMKIIAGMFPPSSGEIRLDGRRCEFSSPRAALDAGIAMIHQELNLVPDMTLAENIWIGREARNAIGLIDHGALRRRTQALFDRLAIGLNPEHKVGSLTIANQQLVEIAKAVSYDSRILIMDEPTSAITEKEVVLLFRIIRQLRDEGKAIVYISHKLNEIFVIADEVSVFRDGHHVGTDAVSAFTPQRLISLMVGRELTQLFPKGKTNIGPVVLSVRDLALAGVFSGVSFDLHRGEILGIAGLVGAGRTNVAETLYGITPATAGEIRIDGKPVVIDSPRRAIGHDMALLTEDRKASGLYLMLSVLENMQIASVRNFTTAGFVRQGVLTELCERMATSLRVKTPNFDVAVQTLSGGNQQKVLIGRWLMTKPRILLLDEPTRGIDVGAKAEIHRLMSQLAEQGMAIIMISSEMPEIIGMSDRIMVMHEGHVSGFLDRTDATQEKILELAAR
jgi:inositol transport system ATP-binding protein